MTRSTKIRICYRGASMLFYPAVLPLSQQTLTYVTGIIRRHRAQIGSPWRKLTCAEQALLVLAYLRKGGQDGLRVAHPGRRQLCTGHRPARSRPAPLCRRRPVPGARFADLRGTPEAPGLPGR